MSRHGRAFEHPNPINFMCPICHTKADAPVRLVAIPGTEKDGIVEACQVHAECIDLYERMRDFPEVNQ